MLADIDEAALERRRGDLSAAPRARRGARRRMDVTREDDVVGAVPARRSNSAGSTSLFPTRASPRPRRSRKQRSTLWNRNMDILSTGYFLVSREAFRTVPAQGSAARWSSSPRRTVLPQPPSQRLLHRQGGRDPPCALPCAGRGRGGDPGERGEPGRRAARVEDMAGEWLDQRASTYKTDKEGLEEMYRQRSLLKRRSCPRILPKRPISWPRTASRPSPPGIS